MNSNYIKRIHLMGLLVLLTSVWSVGCSGIGIPNTPQDIPMPEVALKVVKPETWTLPNGLKVQYLHDDELPHHNTRRYS